MYGLFEQETRRTPTCLSSSGSGVAPSHKNVSHVLVIHPPSLRHGSSPPAPDGVDPERSRFHHRAEQLNGAPTFSTSPFGGKNIISSFLFAILETLCHFCLCIPKGDSEPVSPLNTRPHLSSFSPEREGRSGGIFSG